MYIPCIYKKNNSIDDELGKTSKLNKKEETLSI
jgi:hypothetical protein